MVIAMEDQKRFYLRQLCYTIQERLSKAGQLVEEGVGNTGCSSF